MKFIFFLTLSTTYIHQFSFLIFIQKIDKRKFLNCVAIWTITYYSSRSFIFDLIHFLSYLFGGALSNPGVFSFCNKILLVFISTDNLCKSNQIGSLYLPPFSVALGTTKA